ncbi:A24 family peptidase [Corticimicrobacter populi]|uniref:Prepilin type IV endopeptidase peptidase domain-containing protein n=1 Tax=Corticimicrobacter populi TaxID=2175229 RepID=A0A2V1JU07_9BURK|nr:prepilin peptidase [Corticimicrobacter populi]PWF21469.1 hypothetical protein DD235_14450 [Corticimicrobacter populi]
MPMLPGAQWLLIAALAWVVLSDLLYRRIPNRLVLLLLAVWLLHPLLALFGQGPWAAGIEWGAWLGWPLLSAVLVLVFGYGLFLINRVGAGDVKLMAVLMLWAGDHGLIFLMVTSLAGGVLALALPLLNMIELTLAHGMVRLGARLPGRNPPLPLILGNNRPAGIPYGLAIAAGAACTFGLMAR